MINPQLQSLAKKIYPNAKSKGYINISLSDVRDAINQVSKDYENFTPENRQQVMDILKDKNDSQIQNATGISDDEIETVKLDEQTLDNITGDNDMMESNDNNKMVKAESTAVTFNDDFEKAIEIRKTAKLQKIDLDNKAALEIAEKMPNSFENQTQLFKVFRQTYKQFKENALKEIANEFVEDIQDLRDKEQKLLSRLQLEMNFMVTDSDQNMEAFTDYAANLFSKSMGMSKEELIQKAKKDLNQ